MTQALLNKFPKKKRRFPKKKDNKVVKEFRWEELRNRVLTLGTYISKIKKRFMFILGRVSGVLNDLHSIGLEIYWKMDTLSRNIFLCISKT